MRVVQIARKDERRVALVREPELILLREAASVVALVQEALALATPLTELITQRLSEAEVKSDERLDYDEVYAGRSAWKLLAPVDTPGAPEKTLVSGTGLTHLGSARERQAMHLASAHAPAMTEAQMTDSMRMFEWGRQSGKPQGDAVGIAPEWFYKGDGSVVQAPFAPLEIPGYAEDGGEEAEIAAIYLIDEAGTPWRIGMAAGNEFADHVFEKRNYLNLAGSKLRMCSLGPELVIAPEFANVSGHVRILRNGEPLWAKGVRTGEDNMCHSLANLEHHHFKFEGHRQPGTLHIHFLGADALSFGDGIRLQNGDTAEVEFDGFGRALRSPVRAAEPRKTQLRVEVLT